MIGRLKTAEETERGNRQLLKTMLAGTLGVGAGTGAGYLGVRGADALMRRGGGAGIPVDSVARVIGPVAGAGLGLALGSWQAHQQEMMRRGQGQ
jgi:hypothetical protein